MRQRQRDAGDRAILVRVGEQFVQLPAHQPAIQHGVERGVAGRHPIDLANRWPAMQRRNMPAQGVKGADRLGHINVPDLFLFLFLRRRVKPGARMSRWTTANMPDLAGRRFLVTGPGGLGFETGLALARASGTVIMAGRDAARGEAAVARIRAMAPGSAVSFTAIDLADLSSIRAAAARLRGELESLDVLVNNAGVMRPPVRRTTRDGFELQIGTNHLGHFALTGLLLPLLRAGRQARVVTVSSIAHRNAAIDLDDLNAERRYRAWGRYGQSKLANLLFSFEFDRRSRANGWGVAGIAAHPGVSRSDLIVKGQVAGGRRGDNVLLRLVARLGAAFSQPTAQGALPQLFAASAPQAEAGGYYGPDGASEWRGWPAAAMATAAARDEADARRLWAMSEEMTGVRFG